MCRWLVVGGGRWWWWCLRLRLPTATSHAAFTCIVGGVLLMGISVCACAHTRGIRARVGLRCFRPQLAPYTPLYALRTPLRLAKAYYTHHWVEECRPWRNGCTLLGSDSLLFCTHSLHTCNNQTHTDPSFFVTQYLWGWFRPKESTGSPGGGVPPTFTFKRAQTYPNC